jgi:hypothetical protein
LCDAKLLFQRRVDLSISTVNTAPGSVAPIWASNIFHFIREWPRNAVDDVLDKRNNASAPALTTSSDSTRHRRTFSKREALPAGLAFVATSVEDVQSAVGYTINC